MINEQEQNSPWSVLTKTDCADTNSKLSVSYMLFKAWLPLFVQQDKPTELAMAAGWRDVEEINKGLLQKAIRRVFQFEDREASTYVKIPNADPLQDFLEWVEYCND